MKGIDIKLHLSTLLIVGLVGFYAANFYFSLVLNSTLLDLIIVGLANGLILLISILVHELSHSIMAKRYGLNVSEIELYLFGGVSKIEEEPQTPRSEMLISVVGPLSSLLIGLGLLSIYFLPINLHPIISVTLLYSGISNIGLSIFNLLPAFPIDGGRILRAFLWKRKNNIIAATKYASRIGTYFGYALMIYGFFQIFTFGLINGIWLILMGSFLNSSARQSYIQTLNDVTLSNISVKEMLSISHLEIPFNMIISDALRDYFIPYKKSYFPVTQGNEIIGIIHLSDIKKIPLQLRATYIVGYAMKKLSGFPDIYAEQTGKEALKKLRKIITGPHILIVKEKDDEHLIGFIEEGELIESLKYWSLNSPNS